MRRNRHLLLAALLAVTPLAAKPVQIFKVVAQWQAGGVRLNVWYTGDPSGGTGGDKTNWRLWAGSTATDAPLSRIETFTVTPGSPAILIDVAGGQLPEGCSQTAGCRWVVTFYPVEAPKPATFDTQPPP